MNQLIPSDFNVNVTVNDPMTILYILLMFIGIFVAFFSIQFLFKSA